MELEKILKPRWIDGERITKFYFSTVRKRAKKLGYVDEDELRKDLVYSGGAKFTTRGKEELWGLATSNFESLGIRNQQLIDKIQSESDNCNEDGKHHLLAKILLLHPEFNQRKFSTIKEKFGGFKPNEIRKILVFAGGVRFSSYGGKEYWGLAIRNLHLLGFAYEKPSKKLLDSLKNESENMLNHLANLILSHPMYYRRTFKIIKQKLAGFKNDELRDILFEINAIPFQDEYGEEYWGLQKRNRALLKKLGYQKL